MASKTAEFSCVERNPTWSVKNLRWNCCVVVIHENLVILFRCHQQIFDRKINSSHIFWQGEGEGAIASHMVAAVHRIWHRYLLLRCSFCNKIRSNILRTNGVYIFRYSICTRQCLHMLQDWNSLNSSVTFSMLIVMLITYSYVK